MNETNAMKALRRGMSLMPRYRVLLNQAAVWDDLVVQSATGEWVLYDSVAKHYDVVVAIVQRAEHRAEQAEERARVTLDRFAMIQRENAEYKDLCEAQGRELQTLKMKL